MNATAPIRHSTIAPLVAVGLWLFLGAGCMRPAHEQISQVTMAFSGIGCEAPCPYEALSIDDQRHVQYYGGPYSNRKGAFTGTIPQATWDSVQIRFQKFIDMGFDAGDLTTDQPPVEFIIRRGAEKSRFTKGTGEMSDNDLNTIRWFFGLAASAIQVAKDSLIFETTFQVEELPLPEN